MSGGRKLASRLAALVAALVVLACGVFLVASALSPIPIGPFQAAVEGPLNAKVAPLHLVATNVEAQWRAHGPSVVVRAEQVSLTNPQDERLAFLPIGEAELGLFALIRGEADVQAITLGRPSIDVIRRTDGVFQVGLGQLTPDGARESSLELEPLEVLGRVVSQCGRDDLPSIAVRDGTLHFYDASTETRLMFSALEGTYDAADADGPLKLAARQVIGDQDVSFNGKIDCTAGEETVRATIRPQAVYPAILSDALPGLGFLRPLEVPVSGSVSVRSRSDLSLLGVDFHLTGAAGTMELAEFGIENLGVETAELIGDFDRKSGILEVTRARVRFDQGSARIDGSARIGEKDISVELNARLSGISIGALLPDWLIGFRTALSGVAPDLMSDNDVTYLRIQADMRLAAPGRDARGKVTIWSGARQMGTDVPPHAVAIEFEGDPDSRAYSFWAAGQLP